MAKSDKTQDAKEPGTSIARIGNAVASQMGNTAKALPSGYTVERLVTLPTLVLQIGQPKALMLTAPMYVSANMKPLKEGEKPEKPATVLPCGDLDTGEAFNLLVIDVCKTALESAYPSADYVNRCFLMEKLPKLPGKRYFGFRLAEIKRAPEAG